MGWHGPATAPIVAVMTVTQPQQRVDLFTHIHKGLRKGLFELGVQAGSCDWTDRDNVDAVAVTWAPLAEFLRCHTTHEDEFIFRLLNDPTLVPHDDHRDLDDLLADLDERLAALQIEAGQDAGLRWYRDLMRYTAATLQHLHVEETVVLPALWHACTDEELAACRAAFLAGTPASVMTTTLRLLQGAVEPAVARVMGL